MQIIKIVEKELEQEATKANLNYVDAWAYLKTMPMKGNCSEVVFVHDNSDKNLSSILKMNGAVLEIHNVAKIVLPKDYAAKHENIFKNGLKGTRLKLAGDYLLDEAMGAFPVHFMYDSYFSKEFSKAFNKGKAHNRYLKYSKGVYYVDCANKRYVSYMAHKTNPQIEEITR